MKKGGNRMAVTSWSSIAVGAVGVGVMLAFLAGYLLGHSTGHENTTTVGLGTAATAEPSGATESGEEASSGEMESVPAQESAPAEGKAPAGGGGEAKQEEKPQGGGGEEAAAGKGGNPAAGQEVFATNCSACHGEDGHGGAGGPDLRTMPKAKTEAGTIEQVTNGGGGMPPFEGQLSEEEIDNVAAYVVADVVGGGQ